VSYETIVGLEVHVQLSTRTKLFCSCPVEFGRPQNTLCCPVCLGMPGVLPVLNREAFERAMRAALALGCSVGPRTKFDRKSYYYPDLPKNYQISQYDEPLGRNGRLEFTVADAASSGRPPRAGKTRARRGASHPTDRGKKGRKETVRIGRVHLEEDAGKLVHAPGGKASLVDLNRTGTPLLEIVSEPDIRSGADARAYLEELRQVLRYIGVSECNMEEGSMRCEPNISVRPVGSEGLGTKTEVKNLNSLAAVEGSVEYEARRQAKCLEAGGRVESVTMLWDPDREETRPMRSKEEEQDYRYFPEPDLPAVDISPEWIERVRASVGELPSQRRARYESAYELTEYDVRVLTLDKEVADFFEEVVGGGVPAKRAANWVTQDVLRVVNEKQVPIGEAGVSAAGLAGMIGLIDEGVIDRSIARDRVFPKMVESGRSAKDVVGSDGLAMVSDTSELERIANHVIDENPKPLADMKKNPRAAMRYIGLVRKASGGRADVKVVKRILKKIIRERTGLDVEV
jgi:aspartyl-tRNA(Asn)/glutamyl-tRNA(Gln) amidotransferase subunit B